MTVTMKLQVNYWKDCFSLIGDKQKNLPIQAQSRVRFSDPQFPIFVVDAYLSCVKIVGFNSYLSREVAILPAKLQKVKPGLAVL
jgi:hypothetical protein